MFTVWIKTNLISTDLSLFIDQTRNNILQQCGEGKKEVTQTKSFELFRKNEFHQLEVLLMPPLVMTDRTDFWIS